MNMFDSRYIDSACISQCQTRKSYACPLADIINVEVKN